LSPKRFAEGGRVAKSLPNPPVDIPNRPLKSPLFVIWGKRKQHVLLEKT
jgi:hypothetical protein